MAKQVFSYLKGLSSSRRKRKDVRAKGGAAGAAGAASAAGAAGRGSPRGEAERLPPPVKSPRDYNEYRAIRLANGLTALLISGAELTACTPTFSPDPPIPIDHVSTDLPRTPHASLDHLATADEGDESADAGRAGEGQLLLVESAGACGLCVGVGSFSDPPPFQGLAHLLEHMVFMGSERFPGENDFDVFLNKHGGETNASTDAEATTFYFDVQFGALGRALERFSQLFVSPLIQRPALERELNALESEFQSVLQSDACRRQQLFSQTARPGHPATQFLWGNMQSLQPGQGGAGADQLYHLLHSFRRRHYSAHRMTLAIKAPLPLDVLEKQVAHLFSQVPSNFLPPLELDAAPFDTPHFRRLYCILPVKDTCQLDLTWALPSTLGQWRSKPHALAAWLLGHEGKGSLISLLRRRLWALDVAAGNCDAGASFENNSLYSLFSVHLTLTDEGARHVPLVVEAVFAYIAMLMAAGSEEHRRLFAEVQAVENMDFLFGEEESAVDWVETLALNMRTYPPQEYITGPKLYVEFDPEALEKLLSQLRPDTVNVMLMSAIGPELDLHFERVEPWFGTAYSVRDIPEAWMRGWLQAWQRHPTSASGCNGYFWLPEPNRFLTTHFSPGAPAAPAGRFPARICHSVVLEAWHRQDAQLPVAFLYFQLVSPLPVQSVRNAVLLDLLVTVLKQQLAETLYPAEMALLNYCVYSNEKGLVVRVEGFSQKLPLLLDAIFAALAGVAAADFPDAALFSAVQQSVRRLYRNACHSPRALANELRMALLLRTYWTPLDKLGALDEAGATTLPELQAFASAFLSHLYMQCLLQGDVSRDQALAICHRAVRTLRPAPAGNLPAPGVCQVPLGERCVRVRSLNPADVNGCTVNYYQLGRATVLACCMSELLVQLLDEPAFHALRTQQQLGYDVACQRRTTHAALGFLIAVNSHKYEPDHVDARIEAFLRDFGHALKTHAAQCARRFKLVKRALRSEKECVDFDLQDEVSRNWKEITSNTFLFDRAERERRCLKSIRLKDFRKWFAAHFSPDSRRKLSVQVVGSLIGNRNLEPEAALEPDPAKAAATSRPRVSAPLRFERTAGGRAASYFIADVAAYKKSAAVMPCPGYAPGVCDRDSW